MNSYKKMSEAQLNKLALKLDWGAIEELEQRKNEREAQQAPAAGDYFEDDTQPLATVRD